VGRLAVLGAGALGTGWDGAEDAEPILARHREGRENPSTTGKPVQFAVRQRPIEFGVGERVRFASAPAAQQASTGLIDTRRLSGTRTRSPLTSRSSDPEALSSTVPHAVGKITDFIATSGTLSVAAGLALILANSKPTTVIDPVLLKLSSGGIGIFGYSFIIALVVAVIAHVVYFRSRFGTHVLAIGGSVEAAAATGVRTMRVKMAVYIMSGTLAGLAAILLVSRVGAAEPAANTAFLLNSVAAVVLGGVSLVGGRGSIIGPVLGALLLTALTNGLTLVGVSEFYQPLSVGIVVVLAALLSRF
jgi:hypothetical protein